MTKNFFILFLFLLFILVKTNGQSTSPPSNLLPTITSPSPEVAAFAKYGNYEVNLFNGTPDISIPLYEITVGELKVPISISYNASGIRVSDIPTNIGLGWSLNAGGAITRKVMGGMPDEYNVSSSNAGSFGYLNGGTVKNLEIGSGDELEYFREITDRHRIDAEPDIFSYSIPGKSGKFVFLQEDNLKPWLIPYEPLSVSYGVNSGNFNLIDESGIQYNFKDIESSFYQNNSIFTSITSSWLLSKITSANTRDTVVFNYTSGPSYTENLPNDNITVIDAVNSTNICVPTSNKCPPSPPYNANPNQTPSSAYNYNTVNQKNLETITFKNGKVVFQLASEDRLDFGITNLKKRMQSIQIYNLVNGVYQLIKQINFSHSYFQRDDDPTMTKRLRLDGISIKDVFGATVQNYKFDYNSLTNSYGLPSKNAKAIDYWGYYNGKFESTLVPRTNVTYTPDANGQSQTIYIGSSSYTSRDPDPAYMQSAILKKITYPTGGYTQFYYQTNQYSSTNLAADAKYAGGLRISKIENYDGFTPYPNVKTYIYGQNESGYGIKNFVLDNYYFQTILGRRYFVRPDDIYNHVAYSESIRTFLSNPVTDIEPWDAVPVAYPYVTEYNGDNLSNTGKTVYQFNYTPDEIFISQFCGGSPFILSNHYHRGQILFKTVYKKNIDNTFAPVVQTENHYGAFPDSSKNNSALSLTHGLFSDGGSQYGNNIEALLPPANDGYYEWNGSMEYFSFKYPIQSGDKRTTQTIERTYDTNDPSKVFTATTDYSYENFSHMQPTKIVKTNSKGEIITDYLKYPYEFAQPGNVYQAMVDKHVINKVIEDKKTNNSSQTSLTKYNYYDAGNNNLLPQDIQVQVGVNSIETRAKFLGYDQYGNVLGMQKTNDVVQSYIWDYNNVSPIAMAMNATTDQIAATSFEADGKGNWSFTGATTSDATAPTGTKVYMLSASYPVSKASLQSAATYIVSYWSKSGSYSITGSTGTKQGKTANGWTYYEHTVTGVTTTTISGTGSIDELRFYPSTAQMTTYTYAPLIGVTTSCDAASKITYYIYDDFGRLKWIKDQDGNIIKTIQYHYEGIPGLQY